MPKRGLFAAFSGISGTKSCQISTEENADSPWRVGRFNVEDRTTLHATMAQTGCFAALFASVQIVKE